jgi:hypothetical protein
MRAQMRRRLVAAILATGVVVGGVALPAEAGSGTTAAQGNETYVPFVTDFGASLDEGAPAAEPFIPFVTDFGRSPSTPQGEIADPAEPAASAPDVGIRWRDVGIGAGFGIGLATLVAGTLLAARSRRPAGGAAAGSVRHRAES